MTRIYTGISRVQILVGARGISLLQIIQIRSITQPANYSFFSSSTVASLHSLTTRIRLESCLKNSVAIPPTNLSLSMAHSVTILFYLNFIPMYISLKKLHSFWSYKGTFSHTNYLLHAHYMTHLFHLH